MPYGVQSCLEGVVPEAVLQDGSVIDIEVGGDGPTLLLPVDPVPVEGARAEEMRKWGADPALGRTLIDGLRSDFRVVAFDYEGHVLRTPRPQTLTPEVIAADLLAVADAAGAREFAYYGYSWQALNGLQLAIRTDRLAALVMGGFPPLGGPYAEMLAVTVATHRLAVEAAAAPPPPPAGGEPDWSTVQVTMSPAQTQQFVTLYESLRDFDDRAAQARIGCPRLCLAGSADAIDYGPRWGDVRVDIAGPVVEHRGELAELGWAVHVLDGLDHSQAMRAETVLRVLRPWLIAQLADRG
jgi:pimeloyl-ACP methyl ester carboxylesterase